MSLELVVEKCINVSHYHYNLHQRMSHEIGIELQGRNERIGKREPTQINGHFYFYDLFEKAPSTIWWWYQSENIP